MTDMEADDRWKQYRIRRDAQPDLAFDGQRLASVSYSDGYDRLYQTRSGKLVLATHDVDNDADTESYGAEIFDSMEHLVSDFNDRYGAFSQRLKALLVQASEFNPSFRKFFVQEI